MDSALRNFAAGLPSGYCSNSRLKQEQDNDPDIQSFKRLLLQYPEGKPAAKLLSAESKDVKIFYSNWDQYFLEKGILYKSPEPANRTRGADLVPETSHVFLA